MAECDFENIKRCTAVAKKLKRFQESASFLTSVKKLRPLIGLAGTETKLSKLEDLNLETPDSLLSPEIS